MSHSDVNIQREMTHAKLTYMGVMTIQADWLLIFSNDGFVSRYSFSIESVDQNTLVNIIASKSRQMVLEKFFPREYYCKSQNKIVHAHFTCILVAQFTFTKPKLLFLIKEIQLQAAKKGKKLNITINSQEFQSFLVSHERMTTSIAAEK